MNKYKIVMRYVYEDLSLVRDVIAAMFMSTSVEQTIYNDTETAYVYLVTTNGEATEYQMHRQGELLRTLLKIGTVRVEKVE